MPSNLVHRSLFHLTIHTLPGIQFWNQNRNGRKGKKLITIENTSSHRSMEQDVYFWYKNTQICRFHELTFYTHVFIIRKKSEFTFNWLSYTTCINGWQNFIKCSSTQFVTSTTGFRKAAASCWWKIYIVNIKSGFL